MAGRQLVRGRVFPSCARCTDEAAASGLLCTAEMECGRRSPPISDPGSPADTDIGSLSDVEGSSSKSGVRSTGAAKTDHDAGGREYADDAAETSTQQQLQQQLWTQAPAPPIALPASSRPQNHATDSGFASECLITRTTGFEGLILDPLLSSASRLRPPSVLWRSQPLMLSKSIIPQMSPAALSDKRIRQEFDVLLALVDPLSDKAARWVVQKTASSAAQRRTSHAYGDIHPAGRPLPMDYVGASTACPSASNSACLHPTDCLPLCQLCNTQQYMSRSGFGSV